MTFCLGIRVKDGLLGIADTRVTSGSECITAKKVSVFRGKGWSFFLMTSGLRSVRDKALTYFGELMENSDDPPARRMYKIVNLFAKQIRQVAEEDRESLEAGGLNFNVHVIIGGQFPDDHEHKLYVIYPEGNWVEISEGTPYHIIGASGYGKPVLDRTLHFEDRLGVALKVGCLAFDSTRISASDVDYPMDVVVFLRDQCHTIEHRFSKQDLEEMSQWWQETLRRSVHEMSMTWIEPLLEKLPEPSIPLLKIPDGNSA